MLRTPPYPLLGHQNPPGSQPLFSGRLNFGHKEFQADWRPKEAELGAVRGGRSFFRGRGPRRTSSCGAWGCPGAPAEAPAAPAPGASAAPTSAARAGGSAARSGERRCAGRLGRKTPSNTPVEPEAHPKTRREIKISQLNPQTMYPHNSGAITHLRGYFEVPGTAAAPLAGLVGFDWGVGSPSVHLARSIGAFKGNRRRFPWGDVQSWSKRRTSGRVFRRFVRETGLDW